jgi:hypothetical protein
VETCVVSAKRGISAASRIAVLWVMLLVAAGLSAESQARRA